MSGRDGRESRDRYRNPSSSSSRYDERPSFRMKNPPCRHLWVGNLGNHIAKSTLEDLFFRFGELESVAYPPGRSYAFINFVREDDAVAAFKSLDGFIVADMPLKIEFSKSDKSSASRDDNRYQHRGELEPSSRRSAFSPRESTIRDMKPDIYLPEKLRTSDDNEEQPSERLWIGFPSFLKMEETILRKSFSPFGEIDKITVFPGRTYAFVQFLNTASAVRAKETLQGKLFGNPRVHIKFSRNDHPSSGSGRRGMGQNSPLPHFESHGLPGSSDRNRPDRNFRDVSEFATNEEGGFNELGPYRRSPGREGGGPFCEYSPKKLARKGTYPEDSWYLPEDPYVFHDAKKPKTSSFLQDKEELPEYPLHIAEQGNNALSRIVSDLPRSNESWSTLPYAVHSESPMIPSAQFTDRRDNWKPSDDTFQSPLSPFSPKSEWKRNKFELPAIGMKEVWKWEGTLAKGGTPVCRARCFPVGKVMDIILPEFLDCSARTGLDMLAKHYYQATNSWVVFFVAATDADMAYYNDFMHYLGDKQRAAVAKLDERNTLFLVPPSDFSEKVLKIPGKLSISGVVLNLEPSSPSTASLPPTNETLDRGHFYAPLPPANTMPMSGNIPTSVPSFIQSYAHESGSVSEQARYSQHSSAVGQPQPQPPLPSQMSTQQYPVYGEYLPSGMPFGNNSSVYETKLPTPSHQYPNEEFRPSGNTTNQLQNQPWGPPAQAENVPPQDDSEGDPQKRLQATLQLAASLLKQIQQGKGT